MEIDVGSLRIEIPCPHCGEKIPKTAGELKAAPELVCSACGQPFRVNQDQFRAEVEQTERAIADFGKSVSSPTK